MVRGVTSAECTKEHRAHRRAARRLPHPFQASPIASMARSPSRPLSHAADVFQTLVHDNQTALTSTCPIYAPNLNRPGGPRESLKRNFRTTCGKTELVPTNSGRHVVPACRVHAARDRRRCRSDMPLYVHSPRESSPRGSGQPSGDELAGTSARRAAGPGARHSAAASDEVREGAVQ